MTDEDFEKIKKQFSFKQKMRDNLNTLLQNSPYSLVMDEHIVGFTTLDTNDMKVGSLIKNPWRGDSLIIKSINPETERVELDYA